MARVPPEIGPEDVDVDVLPTVVVDVVTTLDDGILELEDVELVLDCEDEDEVIEEAVEVVGGTELELLVVDVEAILLRANTSLSDEIKQKIKATSNNETIRKLTDKSESVPESMFGAHPKMKSSKRRYEFNDHEL